MEKIILARIGEGVLKRLGIEGRIVNSYESENITLFAESGGKIRYTLRLSRKGYHSLAELEGEINWLRNIKSIRIKKPLSDVIEYRGFYCVLFEYIKEELTLDEYINPRLFYTIGRLTALLHSESSMLIPRTVWNYANMVGKNALWGNWQLNKNLTTPQRLLIRKALTICKKELHSYKTDKFGLIHSDIRRTNLFKENGALVPGDFDDCGYGFYMQELAGSLSFYENHIKADELKRAWLDGYASVTELSDDDKKMCDYFIFLRKIQLLAWITSHYNSQYVISLPNGFENECAQLAQELLKNVANS